MCTCTWSLYFAFFYFFIVPIGTLPCPFFSFDFLGPWVLCSLFFFFFFLVIFFNWTPFFKKVYEYFIQTHFFPFLHFSISNRTKMREIKIFFILSLFHPPTIFYSLTFPFSHHFLSSHFSTLPTKRTLRH